MAQPYDLRQDISDLKTLHSLFYSPQAGELEEIALSHTLPRTPKSEYLSAKSLRALCEKHFQ